MNIGLDASTWMSVEDHSLDAGVSPSELVSMILDGHLPGERRGNRWYVAAPLATLVPGGAEDGSHLLKIAAYRIGSYVTAGRRELRIALRWGDPGPAAALAQVTAAMESTPVLPVEVCLNGETLLIDSSLWLDLGAALVEFETLMIRELP
jgi:hypothetical protein